MPGGPGPWFGTGLGPWLWLAALLVVVAGAVLLLARVDRPSSSDSSDPALARLRERYAAGDVDDEEYRRRRAVLSGDNPGDA
jgi:putative membrane protein